MALQAAAIAALQDGPDLLSFSIDQRIRIECTNLGLMESPDAEYDSPQLREDDQICAELRCVCNFCFVVWFQSLCGWIFFRLLHNSISLYLCSGGVSRKKDDCFDTGMVQKSCLLRKKIFVLARDLISAFDTLAKKLGFRECFAR